MNRRGRRDRPTGGPGHGIQSGLGPIDDSGREPKNEP